MSKEWYPVVTLETCIECGACIEKCSHGVFEKSTSKPKVIFAEGCIEGCTGCQQLCPSGSIEYAGNVGQKSSCKCGC